MPRNAPRPRRARPLLAAGALVASLAAPACDNTPKVIGNPGPDLPSYDSGNPLPPHDIGNSLPDLVTPLDGNPLPPDQAMPADGGTRG